MGVEVDWNDEYAAWANAQWRPLVRAALLLGCEASEVEDLAQATLLRCYLKWATVSRTTHRDAYVARVMVNLHRQSRRRRWWGERPVPHMPERHGPDPTHRVDQADAVRRALDALTQGQREVIVLRYHLDFTEAQIADTLRIPSGTVKSRLSRALKQLADSPELLEGEPR